jgi:hypothetical protein
VAATRINKERAERIARAHACTRCDEYSYKKLVVKEASAAHVRELNVAWQASLVCGVCGLSQELGIDPEGEIVYVN